MGLFDKGADIGGTNYFGRRKLPPGQTATAKFPVLTYGDVPKIPKEQLRFVVWGSVEEEKGWMWEEFMKLPQTTLRADFHCVTHWSRFDDEWRGVLFRDLVKHIKLKPDAKYVMQHAYGGYTTNLPLQWMMD